MIDKLIDFVIYGSAIVILALAFYAYIIEPDQMGKRKRSKDENEDYSLRQYDDL